MPLTIYVSPRAAGAVEPQTPAVATVELARLFGRSAALAGVSLRVQAGRTVALLGANGAGKTTLLRILATAIRPSFGTARVDGIDVAERPDQVRGRVAYLSHATGLYDDLTGAENLRFAATLLAVPAPEREERIAETLATIGLTGMAAERVRNFSAGMRKRLALGRVLLASPTLVLLDEPHAALDEAGMQLVDALLAAWREAGITTLVASHALDRLQPFIDGSVRLESGVVAEIAGSGVEPNPEPRGAIGLPVGTGASV
ncbi:MAG: heme ABC exporter ATP-binding protein CcmA [Candidatus Limnocylindria bacterium]|nr:MAG: heme ABC exporter ATP-binding protein CcmA [Chloroflexota bacterium]